MSRQIEIDDQLYGFIAGQTHHIGEDASSILRRLLSFPPSASGPSSDSHAHVSQDVGGAFRDVVSDAAFRASNTTERMLMILSAAYRDHSDGFSQLLSYRGNKRLYFGRSAAEIDASGKQCAPKRIPGTPFWVMCNTNNTQKQDMVEKALRLLGYGVGDAKFAASSIVEA